MLYLISYIRYSYAALLPLTGLFFSTIGLGAMVWITPQLTKATYDKLFLTFDLRLLAIIVAVNLLLLLFTVLFKSAEVMLGKYLHFKFAQIIRLKVNKSLLVAPQTLFISVDSSNIVKRVTEDTDAVGNAISALYKIGANLLFLMLSSLFYLYIDKNLATVYLGVLASIVLWVVLWNIPTSLKLNQLGRSYDGMYTFFNNLVPGIKEIKQLQIESYLLKKFHAIQDTVKRQFVVSKLLGGTMWEISFWAPWIGFALILLFGMHRVIEGSMSIGLMIAVMTIYWITVAPIGAVILYVTDFQLGVSAAKRLREIRVKPESSGSLTPDLADPVIEFRDVSFGYSESQNILKNVSLTLPANKKIAIVGMSGSGKSTIAQILMKLLQGYDGSITINGIELKEIENGILRDEIAYLTQEVFLFPDSLRNNLLLNSESSEEEVTALLQSVQMNAVVSRLSMGVDTLVGEGGEQMSGGEKQRIAIARILHKNAKVLIMDEATSALDPATEKAVLAECYERFKGKTIISITHRPSTVVDYDLIVVVKDGRIVEVGHHKELLQIGAEYMKIFYSK